MKALVLAATFRTLSALLIVLPSVQANGEGKANPYQSIAKLNPFSLRPPPPLASPETAPPAPLPPLAAIELTGILSIFSTKKVLVEIVSGPGKPPQKLTLDEGERVDAIEVVSIDVVKANVVINNAGFVTNISLKVPSASAAPAVPGAPGIHAPGLVQNTPNPTRSAAHFTPGSSGRSAPMLLGGPAANPTATAQHGIPNASANNTSPSLISRLDRTVQNPNSPQAPAGGDPAVQYINIAIQTQAMQARGIPMPPLPPVAGVNQ